MLNVREVLRALVDGVPAGGTVSVRADWIAELVADTLPTDRSVEIDLSAAEVARLLNRDEKTVAAWCRSGGMEGAYRLRGREWRIPRAALAAFQRAGR